MKINNIKAEISHRFNLFKGFKCQRCGATIKKKLQLVHDPTIRQKGKMIMKIKA